MMERLRYAVASTLLPSGFTPRWGIGGGAAWYFAPCLSFNPRYLMNKRSYTDRKQLETLLHAHEDARKGELCTPSATVRL